MKKPISNEDIMATVNNMMTVIKEGFVAIMEHIVDIREKLYSMEEKLYSMDDREIQDVKELKAGQNRIELRLEHTAHNFMVEDHEERIRKLEKKVI